MHAIYPIATQIRVECRRQIGGLLICKIPLGGPQDRFPAATAHSGDKLMELQDCLVSHLKAIDYSICIRPDTDQWGTENLNI